MIDGPDEYDLAHLVDDAEDLPDGAALQDRLTSCHRYILRLRAALLTLGKTAVEIDAIVYDADGRGGA